MIEKKLGIQQNTARWLVLLFLAIGLILGAADAPSFIQRALQAVGIDFAFADKITSVLPYHLGLDIQGGTHLVYQADVSKIASSEYASSMDAVRDVIERRINLFGVAEPLVQIERNGAEWRLIVELAGIKDVNAAIRLIGATPFLDFRTERSADETKKILDDQKLNKQLDVDPYFVPTALTGRYLQHAYVNFDSRTFRPTVNLDLNSEGTAIFAELTKKNIGKRIGIYLDGSPISAPVVQEEIDGGKAQISGTFTPEAAKELVGRLNAGALPVPIKLISQQSVGASLGEESLVKSLRAGIIGFFFVTLFMILWYRLPGVLSIAALAFYALVVLAVFKLIPVTLTVAGIAGFILSIGMAVDANILIFERMKEELRQGKGLEEAIYLGFARAWTSIRDSNVSSLITCIILYRFGSSLVQGFALTLAIGILVSMFTAISVTRTFLIAARSRRFDAWKSLFLSGISRN